MIDGSCWEWCHRSSKIDFIEMGLDGVCPNRRCADRGHGKRRLNLGETLRNGEPVIEVSWFKDVEGITTVMSLKNNIYYDLHLIT